MKTLLKLAVIAALCLPAFGQVRYDSRVVTVASNVPVGANAPVLAIPNALVTICVDGNCINKAAVWSDQGESVPVANPQRTDGQGRFGFWADPGDYFYKVVLPSGALVGIYPLTLGGSSSGGGINQLSGDVFAGPCTGFCNATLATVNVNVGPCGDATHVPQVTLNGKGQTTACTPVAITSSGGSVGTANQIQMVGSTAGSFAAPPGISYVSTGTDGTLANGLQISAAFTGIPPLPTYLLNVVGSQTALTTNAFYNGTNWITQNVGASVNLRHPISSATVGSSALSVCPTLAAGATIAGMNTTCVAEWTEYNASGPRTWFNSQLLSPTFPTNAALVVNPSANWFVDYSGNQTLNNLTINGTCTGCGGGGGGNTTSTSLTTNKIPKANGANSIINSGLSDDGTTLSYVGGGPSEFSLVQNGNAPTVVTSAFSLAAPTTVTTANTVVGFAAPCSGLWTVTNTAGVMPSTCTTAPTGAIVGTTDTQTLTNKIVNGITLNAAGSASLFLNQAGGYTTPAGGGTVTAVSVATANGVSGSSSGGATPALTIALGAITPSSVAATGAVSGTTGTFTGGITAGTTGGVGGQVILPEGTAATASTTNDVCYGDSTAHAILCSYNNGAFVPLVTTTATQTLTGKSIVATQLTGTLQAGQEPAHTGDVTNSAGSLAMTIAANAVTGAKMANNTVTATQLAAQYSKGSCTEVWGGSGTSFALTSGDDAISNNTCYNDSGVTRTITAVKCRSSVASNTTTVNPTSGAAGTGTTVLSGALTCGSSLAYSSSGTVTGASWTTGTGITPAMGGTLTGTSIAMIVEYTY